MKLQLIFLVLGLCCTTFIAHECYINITTSMPIGLYQKKSQPITQGTIVVFQPDRKKHPFINRYVEVTTPLIKRVACLPGKAYQLPPAAKIDKKGRTIKEYSPKKGVVPANHLIVLGEKTNSLDSRYLGPIPLTEVIDTVKPLFTWRR